MPRLPEVLDREQLPEGERQFFDLVKESRGQIGLPYSIYLNNPDLAYRKLHVGSYVRFQNSLPHNIAELAICSAAREMDARFAWAMHAGGAARRGVSEQAIDVIANRKPLEGLDETEALPIRFTRELLRDHKVSAGTYAAAVKAYGERGVIDLVGTIGYYIMSACWMIAFEIEPPADRPQLPA